MGPQDSLGKLNKNPLTLISYSPFPCFKTVSMPYGLRWTWFDQHIRYHVYASYARVRIKLLCWFQPRSNNQGTLSAAATWAQLRRETASEEEGCRPGLLSNGIIAPHREKAGEVSPSAACHLTFYDKKKNKPSRLLSEPGAASLRCSMKLCLARLSYARSTWKNDILGYYVS